MEQLMLQDLRNKQSMMKLRIVKNSLKVIEKNGRSRDTSNLVKSNGKEFWNETLDEKGHFFDEEVNFQEEFWLTKEYQKWLVSKMLSLKAYCGNKLFTLVFWSLEG